ncbi:unnamed protein product [Rhizoctonia solani]|uniref:Uncharacterized protein n=1 Tax=Rhizoctonia solani TaxID=456999 RepID=A0A8H2XNS8_9AGAM|nr:unnamed protein product [Rhizoctonia solani]
MEASQNGRDNVFWLPFQPQEGQTCNDPTNSSEGMIKSIVSGVKPFREAVGSLCNFGVVIHILIVYLLFVVLPNATPESFSEVPCKLPTLPRYFPHCTRELGHWRKPATIPDFTRLTWSQSRLEYVMEGGTKSSLVSVDLRDSEMDLRNLITMVRYSSLAGKDALARELRLCADGAKDISENLQQFGNNIWGAVGRIVSQNSHTVIELKSVMPETSVGFPGSIVDVFVPIRRRAAATRQKRMEDLWLQTVELLEKILGELIHEAIANIDSLQSLKGGLDNVEDMMFMEDDKIREEEQAFKRRWFRNKEVSRSNSASLELLRTVQDNVEHALKYVTTVLDELMHMPKDLYDLRGMATPASFNASIEHLILLDSEHVDRNMEAPQKGQNNVLPPPPDQRIGLRGVVASIWKYVVHILLVYLLFVSPNTTSESFSGVPVLCKLPVLSGHFPHYCTRGSDPAGGAIIHPDFVTLARLQARLEYVMEDSAGSPMIADNIKDSEITLRDLGTLVKLSSLSRKDTLEQELKLFVENARAAGGRLQEFGSRVWGAVDRIVSLNEHALIVLERMSLEAAGGYFGSIVGLFAPVEQETSITHRKWMEDLWLQSLESLDKTLRGLIHETQANVGFLQRLEARLNNIQDMAIAEEEERRGEERAVSYPLKFYKTSNDQSVVWERSPKGNGFQTKKDGSLIVPALSSLRRLNSTASAL